MTREEAIAYGKDYYRDLITACCEIDEKHKNFVRMSLEALEQEPCEDCISRKAVLKVIDGWYDNNRDTENIEDLIVLITYMSSVQPKEIYNKGWKDGAEATAYHFELCEEENPTIPLSAIEDIKAEIERRADDYLPSGSYDGDLYNGAYRDALYWCFDLMDKYIAESEDKE